MGSANPLTGLAGSQASKNQMPAPPDYIGAANAGGQYNYYANQQQNYANRPNINTPWGGMTWDIQRGSGPPPMYQGSSVGGGNPLTGPGAPGDPNRPGGSFFPGGGQPVGGPNGGQGKFEGDPSGQPTGDQPGQPWTPDQWTMNMTLPEDVQRQVSASQAMGGDRAEGAYGMLGDAMSGLQNDDYWNNLQPYSYDTRQRAEDAIYGRMSSRLDPQWGDRQAQMESQLANKGLVAGTQAYDNAMKNFNMGRNDAYQTALNESIMGGGQEFARQQAAEQAMRQQQISEGTQQQYSPFNAMNALMGGGTPQMPQMPGFNQSGLLQTPNYGGAVGNQYAAQLQNYGMQQANQNSMMGAAASLIPLFFL